MAQITEQLAVIRISKLVKASDSEELDVFTSELAGQVGEVIQELLGDGVVVEIEVGE